MRLKIEDLRLEITPEVYEPSEDSFLLMKHSRKLRGEVLDVGCGSGIQSLINAKNNPENFVTGIDVNKSAVECSRYNAKINKLKNAEFRLSDLFEKVPRKTFDGIIFNPPYLPTSEDEKIRGKLNYALDGGKDGRLIVDRFLINFDRYLSLNGRLLLVQSSLNNLEKTTGMLEKKNFETEILEEESFFFEKLYIIRAERK